ncbi:hypothetical protein KIN20_001680 [Parelaphostrongylus tenuis]|uniref:Uncharacterized protein n=1 Tax=Parelaphostrongylus tenuis TaxID=148309 RepID=A0AAD5QGB1_PARTN|nr:hypothetical protein KIN20_001680 [Parelaphostrongylus tenuis]
MMLRRFTPSCTSVLQAFRALSSDNSGNSKKPTGGVSPKDVLGDELLDAVNSVVEDLHVEDSSAKKATRNTLISKLMSYEKDTFNEATAAQMQEMLSDKKVQALLNSVAADAKTSGVVMSK